MAGTGFRRTNSRQHVYTSGCQRGTSKIESHANRVRMLTSAKKPAVEGGEEKFCLLGKLKLLFLHFQRNITNVLVYSLEKASRQCAVRVLCLKRLQNEPKPTNGSKRTLNLSTTRAGCVPTFEVIVAGKRGCPPEDCGGPQRFSELQCTPRCHSPSSRLTL